MAFSTHCFAFCSPVLPSSADAVSLMYCRPTGADFQALGNNRSQPRPAAGAHLVPEAGDLLLHVAADPDTASRSNRLRAELQLDRAVEGRLDGERAGEGLARLQPAEEARRLLVARAALGLELVALAAVLVEAQPAFLGQARHQVLEQPV